MRVCPPASLPPRRAGVLGQLATLSHPTLQTLLSDPALTSCPLPGCPQRTLSPPSFSPPPPTHTHTHTSRPRPSTGLIPDPKANQLDVAPREFGALAERACAAPLADLPAAFPAVAEELRPFFCLDLAYAHTLLTRGFKIPDDARIHLVKRVEYNGDLVEAAWPLGAAINALG